MICQFCEKELNNKGCYSIHVKMCKRLGLLKNEIIDLYIKGEPRGKLAQRFSFGKETIKQLLLDNNIVLRNRSIANILAHKQHPEYFNVTDETKNKIRSARLRYMKENPEKTAWRKSNISYPEKLFLNKIQELNWDKKYLIIREKSFFPYFIDFAFENEKIAIEIDGSQHLEKNRKESDDRKDKLLVESGWKVIRFTENEIKINIGKCIRLIEYMIEERETYNDIIYVGIFTHKHIINKKYFCNCSNEKSKKSKFCKTCSNLKQQTVNRPPYEQLIDEIKNFGYLGTGRKYGVSDSAIRKWVKMYEKNHKNNAK